MVHVVLYIYQEYLKYTDGLSNKILKSTKEKTTVRDEALLQQVNSNSTYIFWFNSQHLKVWKVVQ